MNHLKNKKILVTGGAGSIGSRIVKKLLEYDVSVIRVFDNDETALFYIGEEHNGGDTVRLLLGDIRDKDRLELALENIDIVFHCAAVKHVPLCEYNPFEAVKTNIMGTHNIIELSIKNNVELFVNVSTDKAVNPISVMGTTKLLSEKIIASTHNRRGQKTTKLCSVRFGNVKNSRGSMYPVFMKQIKEKKCIYVTDMSMTRYMMDVDEAVGLVIKASSICKGGEIFILKMKKYSIGKIATKISKKYNVPIKIIGNRGNEKTHEELMTKAEKKIMIEHDDMYEIPHVEQPYKPKDNK